MIATAYMYVYMHTIYLSYRYSSTYIYKHISSTRSSSTITIVVVVRVRLGLLLMDWLASYYYIINLLCSLSSYPSAFAIVGPVIVQWVVLCVCRSAYTYVLMKYSWIVG